MAKTHNKRRNVGLLYEFLVMHISEGIVAGDSKQVKDATKLLKRYFKKGTELHKEFRLFNALINTTVQTTDIAQKILVEARFASREYDVEKLDREKSLLIKGINHTFNDGKFYDKRIVEYKTYATVQTLLNDWREPVIPDITRLALYEADMVKWLTSDKPKNVLEEQKTKDVDDLLVSLMTKRVDGKYKGLLNNEQVRLMGAYVMSMKDGDQSPLLECIRSLRETTLKTIDDYAKHEQSSFVKEKLDEFKRFISDEVQHVDDKTLTRYLRVAQLKQELIGDRND